MAKYTPHTQGEIKEMLAKIGKQSTFDLFESLPENYRYPEIKLPDGMSEAEVELRGEFMAQKNKNYFCSFTGAGTYKHFIPTQVKAFCEDKRIKLKKDLKTEEYPEEVVKGIFECQRMLSNLTGMDITTTSFTDSATALAHAIVMIKDGVRNKVLMSSLIKPGIRKVVENYLAPHGITVQWVEALGARISGESLNKLLTSEILALYVEQPTYLGTLEDMQKLSEQAHAFGAKFIAGVYPVSLALIKKPAEYGADIAVGDCQSLGLGINHGSSTLGFISVKGEYASKIAGTVAKVSKNEAGELCYKLEKNGSSLLLNDEIRRTLTVGAYLAYTGAEGLKKVATACVSNAHYMQFELLKAGLGIKYKDECFNEFVTISKCTSESILTALAEAGINGGHKVGTHDILWCTTELTTRDQMDKCAQICGEVNQ